METSRTLSTRVGNLVLVGVLVGGLLGTTLAGLVGLSPHSSQAKEESVVSETETWPREFRLNVVGPDGVPEPYAEVEIRGSTKPIADHIHKGKLLRKGNYGTFVSTDEKGQLSLSLSRRPERFSLNIQQPGYGPYWAAWDSTDHPVSIPQEFTAELDAGWSVGGVVTDSSGRPVSDAKVHPSIEYKKRPGETSQLFVGTNIVTDSEGSWRFDSVPTSMSEVSVEINHPSYESLRRGLPRNGFEIQLGQSPAKHILLQTGLTVTGTVTDDTGQPITGALVRTKFMNDIRDAKTDDMGQYRLVGCEPKMARIVVSAAGKATDMQEVRVDTDMGPVDFSMKPGGHVRIRVVDEQGKGIPKARIFFQRWRGMIEYFEFDHVNQYADENGVWEWNEAPLDEFQADICRPDGMQLSYQPLIARDEEYVFKPPQALVVSGRVIDAKTKQPIQAFRVIPGLRSNNPGIGMNWIPTDSYEASDGKYRIRLNHAYPAHLVRIEADSYLVAISRDFMTDEGEVDYDFELHPAEDIAATILTASREPAANAQITLGVAGSQINISGGDIDDGSTYATRLAADAKGHFSIPPPDEAFQLVITHESGFAYLKSAEKPIPEQITLTPWARVEGTFRVGAQPAPNVVLSLYSNTIHSYGDDMPKIFTSYDVRTGEEGNFVFERVFPGNGRIGRRIMLMVDEGATEVTSSQRVSAEFNSGETTRIDLGGTGCPVVGKLVPPENYKDRVFWNFALINAQTDIEPPKSPEPPSNVHNDPEKRQAWFSDWKVTEEGRAWTRAYESYQARKAASPYMTASVDRDGSFRIDDVPPGEYVLDVRFSQFAPGELENYPFVVPEMKGGRSDEPVDLGTIKLLSLDLPQSD